MALQYTVFKEPLIEFRYGQALEDPHDGLSLFGPFDADLPSHPKKITYGLMGTESGISSFGMWSEVLNTPLISEPERQKLWPPFPGFDVAFACEWPEKPSWVYAIDEKELLMASRHKDKYTRTYGVVNIFMEAFKVLEKRDESFDVVVCVVPEEVYKNCRPMSRPHETWGDPIPKRAINNFKKGGKTLYDFSPDGNTLWSSEKYGMSPDFRRQIKARALKYNVPIQIVRETTLSLQNRGDEHRSLTCLSDRAWNLSTALYYKAGGKPWKLASAREGVCYIGISFRRTEDGDNRTACCAAQMFLDSGDGIVFLGEKGPWYSPKNKQFSLDKDAAYNLLSGILKTYSDMGGGKLKELFIHCRSRINQEAFEGYKDACPEGVKLVGIRVKKERYDMRLYRTGKMPVIRGSFLKWNDKIGYLWGTGFKPRLETYDGWEVPIPLKIIVQYGDSPIEQVARDILSLTKLNYNECKLGDSEPVTIRFSDDVGEILVSNPKVKERKPQFKFYI